MNKGFYYKTKYTIPLMIGLIVGFALSILFMPFFECDYYAALNSYSNNNLIKYDGLIVKSQQEQQQLDDYEPRINLEGKPKKPSKPNQKVFRSRYAATELEIKDKLLVGVLTTPENLSTLAVSINQSVASYSDKLIFFVNNLSGDDKILLSSIAKGLSVISFTDDHDTLKPFHTLKYILDHFSNDYDWFMLVSGNTFIRGEKLVEIVNHVSISQDLYLGVSMPNNDIYCSLSSGILLSNSLIKKLAQNMEWCTNNAYSTDASDNIGRCIMHSANLACDSKANGYTFHFHQLDTFNYDTNIDQLKQTPHFNNTLTLNPVNTIEEMNKLTIYFNQLEIDKIEREMQSIEGNILDMTCYSPDGCNGLTWPLGVPSSQKPTNRFEVIEWDYFNETHIYFDSDFDVVNELTDEYKFDVQEVVNFSMKNLNSHSQRYDFVYLLNGYKQFDPTRGATYVLDLTLHDNEAMKTIHKRVNVMRPLGLIELIAMPYVTENVKITIVVVFSVDYEQSQIDAFFSRYERNVLEINEVAEKINLFIVYVRCNETSLSKSKMDASVIHIKSLINTFEKKYSSITTSSSKILQHEIYINNETLYVGESYRQVFAIESIHTRLSPDTLILITPPGIDFQSEFLNRVRLNTIKEHQVFFPIAFYQYNPNVVNEESRYVDEIDVHKTFGYFNVYSYEFVSFYNYDYNLTRASYLSKTLLAHNNSSTKINLKTLNLADYCLDLYELFVTNKRLHLLRAPDQALKYRWYLLENCDKRNNVDEQLRCFAQIERGLASRAQLALHG